MKNIFGDQILTKMGKIGPKISFSPHFLKFGSLDNILEQCITTSRVKTHKTFFGGVGGKFGSSRPKLGPELGFLPFSQVL